MDHLDIVKKKVVYTRPGMSTYTSIPVEFPIGLGQVVYLLAIHWHLEQLIGTSGAHLFIAALSENPEHEATPPVGVAEFQGNQSLYGMATFLCQHELTGTDRAAMTSIGHQIVPLYGLLRPKRQVAVFANVWVATTGCRGEIYYTESAPPQEIVDAINRRYGKYRRT